jgi:DNA mismatch repair protein MutS
VLEHIHDKIRARCLFATHYHELTAMEEILPSLANYTVDIDDNGEHILFLHKIKKGSADRSYGIHVAQLAGLPKSVIQKAKELLNKLEKDSMKSGKKVLKDESHNMNLFALNPSSEAHKKLHDEISKVDPDKLSPREALDIMYFLKSIT